MTRALVVAVLSLNVGLSGLMLMAAAMERLPTRTVMILPFIAFLVAYLGIVLTCAAGILARLHEPLNWRVVSIGVFGTLGAAALGRLSWIRMSEVHKEIK